MPRGDRRGPEGFGPMTGRGYGYCAGYDAPGYAAPAPGRGMGRGMGRRRGRGYGWGPAAWAPGGRGPAPWAEPPGYDPAQELDALRRQAAYFQQGLDQVKRRIDELENRADEE